MTVALAGTAVAVAVGGVAGAVAIEAWVAVAVGTGAVAGGVVKLSVMLLVPHADSRTVRVPAANTALARLTCAPSTDLPNEGRVAIHQGQHGIPIGGWQPEAHTFDAGLTILGDGLLIRG